LPLRPASGLPKIQSGPIVHFLYEPGDGGLDRVAILLANAMADKGLDTELWLTKPDGPLSKLISHSVTVRIVSAPKFGRRGARLFLQIPALARMVREHRPVAIFSAGNQSNLSIALARRLAGDIPTKIVQKITNPIIRPNMSRWQIALRHWRFRRTIRKGDLCLTLSEADAREYRNMFPESADKIRSVHNAYVTEAMQAIGLARDCVTGATDGPVKLLAVGRIAVQKDYPNMLHALALIKHRGWTLTILGDGPLMPDIKALAAELGLAQRITFAGFVSDTSPYYTDCDILILSSLWEGFAAVPLEAMAAGCAIAATDSSAGLTELLAGIGQRTAIPGDPSNLAVLIEETMDRRHVSGLYRDIAKGYSIKDSCDDHLGLLANIMN
jgi:glycosyltransferase involved in cell wall biosynthesis